MLNYAQFACLKLVKLNRRYIYKHTETLRGIQKHTFIHIKTNRKSTGNIKKHVKGIHRFAHESKNEKNGLYKI